MDTPTSLIDQIIKTANTPSMKTADTVTSGQAPTPGGLTPPPAKKPRDPMTAGTVLKLIGSLLVVAVIFFGSFLAYIVFNPDQAAFFVNIFGINPADIQTLLKNLINGSFGALVLVFSIVWIMSLFRAIWTPRDQKRRRLINWLIAGVVGIVLFSILAFWAFLFTKINATDYANPGGNVTIYDNSLYTEAIGRSESRVQSTKNLIGPITLRYDISTNARSTAKKNLIKIESYEINFDGATCANGKSTITGTDPLSDQGLICTFDQIRTYTIEGVYRVRDQLGQEQRIVIPLDSVEIKGLVDISTDTNKDGKKIMTINAARIKNLGTPRWLETNMTIEESKSSITKVISKTASLICLKVIADRCDRIFVISDTDIERAEGSILFTNDSTNLLSSTMMLTGLTLSDNEIVAIDWLLADGTRLCSGTSLECRYTFPNYGNKSIIATIRLANKSSYPITGSLTINEPLIIARHAEIYDQDEKLLNTVDTLDPTLGAYVIRGISVPAKITLDARDVVTENPGYSIRDIIWRISDGKQTIEKVGDRVSFEVPRTQRYTIMANYTFVKNIVTSDSDIRTSSDMIILDLERKSLDPIIKLQQSSDYVPAKITVDASSSQSKNGTIKKFIFDFGEGRPPIEGDAIQTYEYRNSGDKKITLTIIDANNEQATTTKYLILKDTPRNIAFSTSMSPGVIATPIDVVADGATGQIEEWIWNFGDNTPIAKGYETSHTYTTPGVYTITLIVRYIDGTERSGTQPLRVNTTLE